MRFTLSLLTLVAAAAVASAEFTVTTEPISPRGTRATADLPASQHMRNTGGLGRGGPGTGAGLCVWTAIEHDSRWANVAELSGLQQWMTERPGGGYPGKVDQLLPEFCGERNKKVPGYVQHTGGDLEFLKLAIKTRRALGITYCGADGVFYGSVIAHMVNLIHLDDREACILDNNNPGKFLWMSPEDLASRWRGVRKDGTPYVVGRTPIGGGWAFCLTAPPPPPYSTSATFNVEQCGPGGCRVPYSPTPPGPQMYAWEKVGDGDWLKLTKGTEVIGYWNRDGWYPSLGPGLRTQTAQGKPPVDPPAEAAAENNFGLDLTKMHYAGEHRYYHNGAEVSRKKVVEALAAGGDLTNDSTRKNLAAVGNAEYLVRVKAAFLNLDPATRDKLHLQLYAPGHWAVEQFRLGSGLTLRDAASPDSHAKTLGTLPTADLTDELLKVFIDSVLNPAPPAPSPSVPQPMPAPDPVPAKAGGYWLLLAAVAAVVVLLRK